MKLGLILGLSAVALIALWLARTQFSEASLDSADVVMSSADLEPHPLSANKHLSVLNGATRATPASSSLARTPGSESSVSQSLTFASSREASADHQPSASGEETPTPSTKSMYSEDVIGRPFPLSPTMEASCKRTWEADFCEYEYKLLSQLAQQPRDQMWAADAERSLREYVLSEEGDYAIRALECRQTLCAIEAASINGILAGLGNTQEEDFGLSGKTAYFAYESNEYGMRVTVTLRIYERK